MCITIVFGFFCLYYNADSLLNKRGELELTVNRINPDIIFITESLPKASRFSVQVSELGISGYQLFTNDDPKRGVCVYHKETLTCRQLKKFTSDSKDIEVIWTGLELTGRDKLLLGCIYRSSNSTDEHNLKLNHEITQGVSRKCYSNILIADDFNYPEIDWANCLYSKNYKHMSSLFLGNIRDSTNMLQEANILDLSFNDEEDMIDKIEFLGPLGKCHHGGLSFTYKCCYHQGSPHQGKLHYKHGDFFQLRQKLHEIDCEEELGGKDKDAAFDTIQAILQEVTGCHIPFRYFSTPGKKTRPD
ncbi:hypothetical protein HOLleu_02434 [Holothuria leucospilota]|uniref:Endonuclease/exonuclease/phosphatase domain-containing protein n=1 Tax=Holothuria leucospilota TaxID=206669 RepID=A0A9Q1CRA6_HOLLE|nr:hypothetical protein HOLleu_02434 [Holothuria leucospilota]